MVPLLIGAALLCVALAGAAAYLLLWAPMSADGYKAVAATNMTTSLRMYKELAETAQGLTAAADGSLPPAQISSAIRRLAQLKRDVDALTQQTSELRPPAAFKGTQQSLLSWLGALSEMVEREHTSLTALKQGATSAELEKSRYAQFSSSDPAVQELDDAISDAVLVAEKLGVDSGMIDDTIRSGSVSMQEPSEPVAQADEVVGVSPQLTPEQLEAGNLPAGHPSLGGDTPAMTKLPSGMTPQAALRRFNEDIISNDFAGAYALLPLDKQQSYGSATAFGEQVRPYGVTGFKNGTPATAGDDQTIVSTMETPQMPVTYTWTYTRVNGSWYVKSRVMGGSTP